MLAVIKTGGKQFVVEPGIKLNIEKLEGNVGDVIKFSEVLLMEKDGKVSVGKPLVKNAEVEGKILKQGRTKKIIVYKYKSKKRYHKKQGHRQFFSEVEIVGIKA